MTWREVSKQIQGIIDKNPELQGMIKDLRKSKVRGTWEGRGKQNKIIQFKEFLKPKA
jgi:hypothetical protein